MLLRIDSARLHDRLQQRREMIGFGSRAVHLVAVVEGVFLILTAVTTSMGYWWRIGFVVAATVVTMYAAISVIITWSKGYNADDLYQEMVALDRTERRSSIIAINDGNRYLLYHDTAWDCDFFPNHPTSENDEDNLRRLTRYLSDGFDIPQSDFTLVRIAHENHEKYSTEHHEKRWYEYTLYHADIIRMPQVWRHDQFHVDSKDCLWMTVEQMMDNPIIRERNADVVGMVRRRL